MPRYTFSVWNPCKKQLKETLKKQHIDFQMDFQGFIDSTVWLGWSRRQKLETLDNCYETYALLACNGYRWRAMLTRGVNNDDYLCLGLTCDADPKDQIFQLACQAHGLTNPIRTP